MATILDKDLIRESTVKYDNREIVVTLTEDQKISFKLKGMKSGEISIGIGELYNQLKGDAPAADVPKAKEVVKKQKRSDDAPMINLYDLRTNNLVTKMDFNTKLVLESLIVDLIGQNITLVDK